MEKREIEMTRIKRRSDARTHAVHGRAWLIAMAAAAASLLFASAKAAQMDAREGRALAEAWCSGCHVVAPTARVQSAAPGSAPDFSAVAKAPTTTEQALTVFLQVPHPPMPDFQMSRGQINALVTYILSLRER